MAVQHRDFDASKGLGKFALAPNFSVTRAKLSAKGSLCTLSCVGWLATGAAAPSARKQNGLLALPPISASEALEDEDEQPTKRARTLEALKASCAISGIT